MIFLQKKSDHKSISTFIYCPVCSNFAWIRFMSLVKYLIQRWYLIGSNECDCYSCHFQIVLNTLRPSFCNASGILLKKIFRNSNKFHWYCLIRIMAWRLVGIKTLTEPMLTQISCIYIYIYIYICVCVCVSPAPYICELNNPLKIVNSRAFTGKMMKIFKRNQMRKWGNVLLFLFMLIHTVFAIRMPCVESPYAAGVEFIYISINRSYLAT